MASKLPLAGLMAVGYTIAYFMVWKRRDKLAMSTHLQVHGICIVYMIAGLTAITVFAIFENGLRGEGFHYNGISLYGIYLLMPVFLFAYSKITRLQYLQVMDVYAVAAIPCLFLGRMNCIIGGCCYGKLIHGTELRWPTREVELVYIVFMLFFMLRMEKKNFKAGSLFPLIMALYGGFRFFIEWFRYSSTGHLLDLSHFWSVVCLAIGLSIFFELNTKEVGKQYKKVLGGAGHDSKGV